MSASIKGNQIILAKRYFTQRFGEDALEKIFNTMSPINRAIIERQILSGAWEPEEAYIEFLAKADEVLGIGDYQLDWECGRFLAKQSIPTIYKIFIRLGDPAFVIERADRFWHQVHSSGRLETVRTDKNKVIGKLLERDYPHKAFCASLMGYFYGTLELCGAKEIKITEIMCSADKASHCEYAVSWQ
jgi:predicted hydrocarbon binding protein